MCFLCLGSPLCDSHMAFAKSFHLFIIIAKTSFAINLIFKFTSLNTLWVIQIERLVPTTHLKEPSTHRQHSFICILLTSSPSDYFEAYPREFIVLSINISKWISKSKDFFFFLIIWLWFNYSCLHCLPTPPSPQPNPPPSPASTLPLGFVHVSFIVVPENPSPHCPLPTPRTPFFVAIITISC